MRNPSQLLCSGCRWSVGNIFLNRCALNKSSEELRNIPAAPCGRGVFHRYDFEAYTETSEKMYRIFLRFAPMVMAVSCDEAFLELAEGTDPMQAATRVRPLLLTGGSKAAHLPE